MGFRKKRKSRFQEPTVSVHKIIVHFLNRLQPVKVPKELIRMSNAKRKKLDPDDIIMIKSGYYFQGDLYNERKKLKPKDDFQPRKEKLKRPRIIREKILVVIES